MVYAYAPNFTWNGIFSLPRGTENRSKYRYFDKIEGQSSHRMRQPAQIWHARADLLMVDRRKDGRDVLMSSAPTAERTGGCASHPSNGGSIALVSYTFSVHSGHYSIARDT